MAGMTKRTPNFTHDEPGDTPAPPAPFVLQLALPLPEQIAEFGLAEEIRLPGDILEHWGQYGDLIQQAVTQQLQQICWSLATSLNAVLAMRAEHGEPLTHEVYIERQQALLNERTAAAAAARAATEALANGAPDA